MIKCATTYWNNSRNWFWVVENDPIFSDIGDGVDTLYIDESANSAYGSPGSQADLQEFEDWQPLTFQWMANESSTVSTDLTGMVNLYKTYVDQTWPLRLLPRTYLPAEERRTIERTQLPPSGSFGGNIAVLIALVAFTASRAGDRVQNALISCIRDNWWQTPNRNGRDRDPDPGCT
jgi:hypothetical protein